MMSDEVLFHLDGCVNKQNCRFWSNENPQEFVKTQMKPLPWVAVWCGITSKQIISPYFFTEKSKESNATVTSPRYCKMLTDYVIPQLQETCSISSAVKSPRYYVVSAGRCVSPHCWRIYGDVWKPFYFERGSVDWPARSPDLTAADLFLWRYVKQEVYKKPVKSIQQLKVRIHMCVRKVSSAMLTDAFEECVASEN